MNLGFAGANRERRQDGGLGSSGIVYEFRVCRREQGTQARWWVRVEAHLGNACN